MRECPRVACAGDDSGVVVGAARVADWLGWALVWGVLGGCLISCNDSYRY